jgi:hypothetical protein
LRKPAATEGFINASLNQTAGEFKTLLVLAVSKTAPLAAEFF